MAAASVSSTLRASERSATKAHSSLLGDFVDRLKPAQQRFEQVEPERVLRVALRARRLFVDFEKDAVDTGRDTGRCERLDEFRLPRSDAVSATRKLKAVGDVEHHRYTLRPHQGKRPHVDHQVVVAEARAALR